MIVSELIELLKTMPQDIKVYYTDNAFGGPYEEVEQHHISIEKSNESSTYGQQYLKIGGVGCDCHLD